MKKVKKNLSIIDKDLSVDGSVTSKGRLVINGTIKGKLNGETVIIAEDGEVYSDAEITSMTVGGIFEGEINAHQELIILSTGKVTGRVICKDLIVESGGKLNAEVICKTSQEIETVQMVPNKSQKALDEKTIEI